MWMMLDMDSFSYSAGLGQNTSKVELAKKMWVLAVPSLTSRAMLRFIRHISSKRKTQKPCLKGPGLHRQPLLSKRGPKKRRRFLN